MKRRILNHKRYDEKCRLANEWWTIEEWRKGLFKWRWYVIDECGYDIRTAVEFKTLEEAQEVLDRIKHGDPRDTVVSIIAETHDK